LDGRWGTTTPGGIGGRRSCCGVFLPKLAVEVASHPLVVCQAIISRGSHRLVGRLRGAGRSLGCEQVRVDARGDDGDDVVKILRREFHPLTQQPEIQFANQRERWIMLEGVRPGLNEREPLLPGNATDGTLGQDEPFKGSYKGLVGNVHMKSLVAILYARFENLKKESGAAG
jgi:hypothetical protein